MGQVSGRSCAKVINTDVKNAVVKLQLAAPGLVAGRAYSFCVKARVSTSLSTTMRLQVLAENKSLCSARVAGCGLDDLLVLGSGNATATWSAVSFHIVAPLNSTAIYVRQSQRGLLWPERGMPHGRDHACGVQTL